MKDEIIIRNETAKDFRVVEKITRDAFWNVNAPGCDEHYLVHIMRGHEDFIPELDFVITLNGVVIGNVMYTKAKLVDENGSEKEILTFGPVSIAPEYQRKGHGKALLEYSFRKALNLGFDTIVIFGDPNNYVSRGFKCCKKYNVCVEGGVFPTAMLVKELIPGALDGRRCIYHESPVYNFNEAEAEKFDAQFEKKEKLLQPGQEIFYILSHSSLK